MDILDKLKSQIGDDVQHVFDRDALFKEAIARIKALEAQAKAADALAEWVKGIIEDGCPRCGGDCSSENPAPSYCPQKEVMRDLAAYLAAKKGGAE